MGCDIHLYGEKFNKRKWWKFWVKSKWVSIDKWSDNEDYPQDDNREKIVSREDRIYTGGRNYNLFAALCGVRNWNFIGNPPMISEPKGLPKDCCELIKKESELWGSDGHSHTWATLKELQDFNWNSYGKTCDAFRNEVIPKLQAQGNPEMVRIVFWFDN